MSQMIDVRVLDEGMMPPWRELAGADEMACNKFAVMQGAMVSGKAGMLFVLEKEGRQPVYFQMSAEMFDLLYGVVKGARVKWKEIPG